MNSILRELLIDATEISENYEKGTFERVVDHKIFAELIVMECANVIQDFIDHRFPASEYPIRLKKYFGINYEKSN